MLLTLAFHVAQGTFSYGVLGFTGADAARMDWLVGALWCRDRQSVAGGRSTGRRGESAPRPAVARHRPVVA